MEIFAWAVYGFAAFMGVGWLPEIRSKTKSGIGITIQTVNTAFLFLVALALVPILEISPFHIVWMFIASFILGGLSIIFPFSLLSIFGNILGGILCIGLDQEAIEERRTRIRNLRKVILTENVAEEEAKEILIQRGEW
jgi:hypothetical protein